MQNHRDHEGSAPRGSFSPRTPAPALAALLAVAACGGSGDTPAVARSPCPQAIAGAVGPAAQATLDDRAPDLLTCTYRAKAADAGSPVPARAVRVTIDTAPQAARRFARTIVEQGQAHLGDSRAELPQQLDGIGEGAAWTAAPRQLLATDGGRLVTVTVVSPSVRGRARAIAVAVARAALRR